MATKFNSAFNETLPFSDTGAKMQLATAAELTWTVPGTNDKRYRAQFSMTADAQVWVAINKAAVAPLAGTVADTYNEQYRPECLYVRGGDVLSFITSSGTPQVGVSLLELPSQ